MTKQKANYLYLPVDSLVPYANNARTHSDEQVEKIARSLNEFGFINPVLIDADNMIIAGHGRVLASKKIGLTEVPCLRVEHLSPEQVKAYIIADNKLAEDAGWDMSLVVEELAELNALDFDTSVTGFDLNFGSDWFEQRERYDNDSESADGAEYQEFVEKFENKRTTDDCYTPDLVYDAVASWVEKEYGVNKKNFVRPFYPNGDYQKFAYTKNAIVVDNPPFSILKEIVLFYTDHNIKYFLFCPALTSFNCAVVDKSTLLCCGATITYENGAKIATSFITNIDNDELLLRTAPDLQDAIKKADEEIRKETRREVPKYEYPDCVVSASMCNYMSQHGADFRVKKKDAYFIRQLDAQKEYDKTIFGSGFLLSEKATAEKATAEKATAEKATAEKATAEKATAVVWKLSDREKEIIKQLGGTDGDD